MLEKRTYDVKKELLPLLKIPYNQFKKRKEDLLEWFKDFFEYEVISNKPIKIKITEVYGEYQPLPRKVSAKELTLQKEQDYKQFVINNLSTDFKPESKCHMARKALKDFGKEKYNHFNDTTIARRYVGPAMEEVGEKDDTYHWVDYSNYEILNDENLTLWYNILEEEHIGEKEAAAAFYKAEQGQDITKERNSYKKALERMKIATGIIPVKVAGWRLREIYRQLKIK